MTKIFVAVVALFCVTDISVSSSAVEPSFRVVSSTNGKTIAVICATNTNERKSYVTVFEVLMPSRRLRRLHEAQLETRFVPEVADISASGRFLITMDDESCYALAVYDLVREERSIYELEEFIPESVVRGLKELDNDSLVARWFVPIAIGENINEEMLEFYPTPKLFFSLFNDEPLDLLTPFVVVDLPTRRPRVEPRPQYFHETEKLKPRTIHLPLWRTSNSLKRTQNGQAECASLPEFIRSEHHHTPVCIEPGKPINLITYRLIVETREYRIVLDEEWEEIPPNFGRPSLE